MENNTAIVNTDPKEAPLQLSEETASLIKASIAENTQKAYQRALHGLETWLSGTGQVVIKWTTASELNNAGFNILRSQTRKAQFVRINPKLIAGQGTSSELHTYSYTDTTAKPNVIYYYRIEDVSFDGVRQTLATVRLKGDVSARGKLTTMWGDLKGNLRFKSTRQW